MSWHPHPCYLWAEVADGRAGITVPRKLLTSPGQSHSGGVIVPAGGNGRAGALVLRSGLVPPGQSHAGRIATEADVGVYYFVEPLAGVGEVVKFHTGTLVGNGTYYLLDGAFDTDEAEARSASVAGTAAILTVFHSLSDLGGASAVFTLRREGADTGLTKSLTGVTFRDSASLNVSYTALQWRSLKLVISGMAAGARAKFGAELKFTPA